VNRKTVEKWSAYLEELHARIAHRFLRPEVSARAYRYLAGLLGEVRRKNSWQMAEAIGEARPRGVQHLPMTPAGTRISCATISELTWWSTSETKAAGCSSSTRRVS
jgi:hypothetical protein